MIRYLRYIFLAALAVVLVTVAVANRAPVKLQLLNEEVAALVGINGAITLPLYAVIFGGIVAGLLIGFVWEWLREHRVRAEASSARYEKERLEREVKKLKAENPGTKDEVLALLEGN